MRSCAPGCVNWRRPPERFAMIRNCCVFGPLRLFRDIQLRCRRYVQERAVIVAFR